MPVHNSYIGQVFDELADLLEIEGANPFRVRAYRNAARVVGSWPESLAERVAGGKALPKLPGLGEDLTEKVREVAVTGKLSALSEVEKKVPKGLGALLRVPGLGPKRVMALRERFGIRNIQDLAKIARRGKIRDLPGFGEKIEKKILEETRRFQAAGARRIKLRAAEQIAASLVSYLEATPGPLKATVAGSFRRRLETVGDLDILVTCERLRQAERIMRHFVRYEEVAEVLAQGLTKTTVLLRSGVQVDLRVVGEESYGAALFYFTGSKAHNIAIRILGVRRGLKVNEYGVFKGKRQVAGRTEEEVYATLGLPYIEPELREARGEIEAAREHRLPDLVRVEDIRGDLHSHTSATDGRLTLEEAAAAARRRGYEYLAITDHSRHLTVARGLDPARLRAQIRAIERLNAKLRGIRLLKAIEVDILEDGKLDLPDKILRELDLTVCSVHSKFDLSERKQTERILRAMDNRYFTILGHPTGRLIGGRPGYAVDLSRIMKAAAERGRFLEINAQPDRMDLSDVHCQMARELGVIFAISTDAHGENDYETMRLGVSQARRGWLEAKDVVNTRSLPSLLKLIGRT